jgi:hypothetical protein
MAGTPTRCGYCGRRTVTRAGRCPDCGHAKSPPAVMAPPPPPGIWREFGGQIAALVVTVLLVVTAIAIGVQVLLFLAILVLCALVVLLVVGNGIL